MKIKQRFQQLQVALLARDRLKLSVAGVFIVAWLAVNIATCFTAFGEFAVGLLAGSTTIKLTELLILSLVAPLAEEPVKFLFYRHLKFRSGLLVSLLYGMAESVGQSYWRGWTGPMFDWGRYFLRTVKSGHVGYFFVGDSMGFGKAALFFSALLHGVNNFACWLLDWSVVPEGVGYFLYFLNLFAVFLVAAVTFMRRLKEV